MRKEMVLAEVRDLIRRRREAHRFPECVTIDELVKEQTDFSRAELIDTLHQLAQDGDITIRPAINCLTVYINE